MKKGRVYKHTYKKKKVRVDVEEADEHAVLKTGTATRHSID